MLRYGVLRCVSCAAALLLLLAGCAPGGSASGRSAPICTEAPSALATQDGNVAKYPFLDASLAIEERVADLLGRMTLEEKAGQMIQAEIGGLPPALVKISALGSVLNGGNSVLPSMDSDEIRDMVKQYQDAALACRLPIPLLYGLDAVHGHNGVTGAVLFPQNIGLGAANSPELMEQMGETVASEMMATGTPWNFAPCVAAAQDPRWGRTYESFSSDPALVSKLAVPLARGLMKGGALPTAKHYLADGGAIWGTPEAIGRRIDRGDAVIDEATLRSLHLPQYRALVDAGVPTVMTSFSSWNGVRMGANQYLLTDVLKGELGFGGIVVSDYDAVEQLAGASLEDKVAASVNAGVDMFMESSNWNAVLKAIVSGVSGGKIAQARVDDAVSRILRVKFEYGLFEDPYLEKKAAGELGTQAHRALAAELVGRSLVLLKNDNGILPFKSGQKILVVGPAADDLGVQCGGWSLDWQGWSGDNGRTQGTTILEGLKQEAEKAGAEILTDTADAAKADAILLVVGEKPYAEMQGDSADMSLAGPLALPGNKEAMEFAENCGKPVVALLVAGRQVIITDELPGWDAAVMAYLPGTEGEGIAPVLFGEKDFTGKLPMPWYGSVEDIGEKDENLLFPMGYGLSYSK
jgi:beta-glucosidase